MEGFSRVGSRLLVGAIPIDPARAAARSERISACYSSVSIAILCEIREAYQISGNDCIQGFRLQHHPGSHCVHQHLIKLNVWEVFCHLVSYRVPHNHTISLRITLGNHSEMFLWSTPRNFKSKPEDSLD